MLRLTRQLLKLFITGEKAPGRQREIENTHSAFGRYCPLEGYRADPGKILAQDPAVKSSDYVLPLYDWRVILQSWRGGSRSPDFIVGFCIRIFPGSVR